jgi:AcrR family transcriptional regulator
VSKVTRNPERTAKRILDAATAEFSEKGLGGARVDTIAERSKSNKRMLYHYFGNKEDLFLAVMEQAYMEIRIHERDLNLDNLPPTEAVKKLVGYTFNYFLEHPEFIRLLNTENLYGARHIKKSDTIRELHSPLVDQISQVLARGVEEKVFRDDVDPVQFYISIASLGYFYLSNTSTLGEIFGKDLRKKSALKARMSHIEDMVLGYLRP